MAQIQIVAMEVIVTHVVQIIHIHVPFITIFLVVILAAILILTIVLQDIAIIVALLHAHVCMI